MAGLYDKFSLLFESSFGSIEIQRIPGNYPGSPGHSPTPYHLTA
jgi:hypothetical protein